MKGERVQCHIYIMTRHTQIKPSCTHTVTTWKITNKVIISNSTQIQKKSSQLKIENQKNLPIVSLKSKKKKIFWENDSVHLGGWAYWCWHPNNNCGIIGVYWQ